MTDPLPFASEAPPIRAISFSLWGFDRKYTHGFEANIELARRFYPGWDVWVFHDHFGPWLDGADRKLHRGESNGHSGLFWRIEACCVEWLDAVLVRDADSRLNEQEADATQEWLESGRTMHVMHSHRHHAGHRVMGGLFSVRPWKLVLPIDEELKTLGRTHCGWGTDQEWLAERLGAPLEEAGEVLHHTSVDLRFPLSLKSDVRPFRVQLPGGRFPGQQHEADGTPIFPR
jgi:hypothetical protein